WRFLRAGSGARLGLAVAGVAGIAELLVIAVITPAILNGGLSARPVGEAIAQLESEGHPVALYHFQEGEMGAYLFYARRTVPNLENLAALREYLDADPPGEAFPPMAIIPFRRFEKVSKSLPFPLVEVRRWRFRTAPWEKPGGNDCLLVTRGPATPASETLEDQPAPAGPEGAAPRQEPAAGAGS
ncbi:MAG TPA: hypothetical protein VNI57_05920, partial [Candidatus Saccharimonadales bacterium]|nr:hypothetical protein [Candidatus Saccharimonadales bacterium]